MVNSSIHQESNRARRYVVGREVVPDAGNSIALSPEYPQSAHQLPATFTAASPRSQGLVNECHSASSTRPIMILL